MRHNLWPIELAIIDASGEGIPLARSEHQRRAGRVLGITEVDEDGWCADYDHGDEDDAIDTVPINVADNENA